MKRFERKLLKESVLVGLMATFLAVWVGIYGFGPIQINSFRLALADFRARHFQYFHAPPTDQIVHMDIDDVTVNLLGWPIPRHKLAPIIDEINLAGAKVVDLDVIYPEPASELDQDTGTIVDADKLLAGAATRYARNGRGVLMPISVNIGEIPSTDPLRQAAIEVLEHNLELELPDLEDALVRRGFTLAEVKLHLSRLLSSVQEDATFMRVRRELQQGTPADVETLRKKLLPISYRSGVRGDSYRSLVSQLPLAESVEAMSRFTRPYPPGLPPLLSQDGEQEIPIPSLARSAAFSGFVDFLVSGNDPTVRSIPLWILDRNRMVPQMGLSLACAELGANPNELKLSPSSVSIPVKGSSDIVIPVHDESTDRGRFGMVMDIPWIGTDDWRTMYDWPNHQDFTNHIALSTVWDICNTEPKIEDNNREALTAACKAELPLSPDQAQSIQANHPAFSDWQGWNKLMKATYDDVISGEVSLDPDFLKNSQDYISGKLDIDTIDDPKLHELILDLHSLNERPAFNEVQNKKRIDLRNNLARKLYGKAVLIGWIATGAIDHIPTPLHAVCPGVVIHGAIANAILTRYFIHPAAAWVNPCLIVFIGLIVTFVSSYFEIVKSSLVAGLIVVVFVFADFFVAFDLRRTEVDAAAPLLAAVLSYVGCTLWRYFRERGEKNRITRRFSSYVDPNLVNYMLDHPEQATFKGEERELTVVFTDLAGFTSVSEVLKRETVPLLNEYLGLMEPVIRSHHGLLNKFLGDGIMFFFGAPEPYPGDATLHAMAAVETVVEMQRVMLPFNESLATRGLPALKMRAGVSTGDMVVGDAGTESRSDYTVLGDRVNFAARLESANKATGTLILVSDRTVELLKNKYLVRPIGRLQVVGKKEPVMTYEPMALIEHATDDMMRLVKMTRAVTDSFADARFAECMGATHELLAAFGEKSQGPLCALYRRLSLEYLRKPPEEFLGQIKLESK